MLTRHPSPETGTPARPFRHRRRRLGAAGLAALVIGITAYAAANPFNNWRRPAVAGPRNLPGATSQEDAHPAVPIRNRADAAIALGFSLLALTPAVRRRYAVAGGQAGILVTGVRENSPAAEAGFRPGDVILEVDGQAVRHREHLMDVLHTVASGERDALRLLVSRHGDPQRMPLSATSP